MLKLGAGVSDACESLQKVTAARACNAATVAPHLDPLTGMHFPQAKTRTLE